MADVKVCDRCGKPIVQKWCLFNTLKRNGYYVLLRHMSNPWLEPEIHNLCYDCAGKFMKWMEGENEEAKDVDCKKV